MSSTVAGTHAPPREASTSGRNQRSRRIASVCAGPAVIVLGVLFALRGFAFHPLLTNDHPDVLAFWLPRFAFLGRELSAGHIPLWNPNEMLGYRFAADPQSGWLYVPPMVLFSALSPCSQGWGSSGSCARNPCPGPSRPSAACAWAC